MLSSLPCTIVFGMSDPCDSVHHRTAGDGVRLGCALTARPVAQRDVDDLQAERDLNDAENGAEDRQRERKHDLQTPRGEHEDQIQRHDGHDDRTDGQAALHALAEGEKHDKGRDAVGRNDSREGQRAQRYSHDGFRWERDLTGMRLGRLELFEDVLERHKKENHPAGQPENVQRDAIAAQERFAEKAGNQQRHRREERCPQRDLPGQPGVRAFREPRKGPTILNGPSIRNRIVNICPDETLGTGLSATAAADAVLALDQAAGHRQRNDESQLPYGKRSMGEVVRGMI